MGVFDRHGKLVTRFAFGVLPAEAGAAAEMLAGLKTIRDSFRPKAVYDRKALPLRWARVGGLGADVKDLMLARAVEVEGRVFDSDGFTLRHGVIAEDPYTGGRIEFQQLADATKRVVDLDHVVSLADAFVCGAYRWRADGPSWGSFANDPGNIIACGTAVNQSKGARDAAGWLPPNPVHDFRCRFVILQIQVKARYNLAVTESEAEAMRRVLQERLS